jgi:hypothetical protein
MTERKTFEKQVLSRVQKGDFKPFAAYDPEGDCIEFIAAPDPFKAKRIDELVTVYYSRASGEIVGSFIKNVSAFCRDVRERFPGFKIVVKDGRVRLEHLFLVRILSSSPEQIPVLEYQKLMDVAERAEAETELTCV